MVKINNGEIKIGLNEIFLDNNKVGSFVIFSIGEFKDKHSKKIYENSIFLQGGFVIKDEFRFKGIAKEAIKTIFNLSSVDNIFLYALDKQGAVDIWKNIGGVIIFRDDSIGLNLMKISKKKHQMININYG